MAQMSVMHAPFSWLFLPKLSSLGRANGSISKDAHDALFTSITSPRDDLVR